MLNDECGTKNKDLTRAAFNSSFITHHSSFSISEFSERSARNIRRRGHAGGVTRNICRCSDRIHEGNVRPATGAHTFGGRKKFFGRTVASTRVCAVRIFSPIAKIHFHRGDAENAEEETRRI
jgi:hypothetical protein